MNENNIYTLRYNKTEILFELLFELFNYEKNKNKKDLQLHWTHEKYYAYIDNIIKLLYHYIFNINEIYYTIGLDDIEKKSSSSYETDEYENNKDFEYLNDNNYVNFLNTIEKEKNKCVDNYNKKSSKDKLNEYENNSYNNFNETENENDNTIFNIYLNDINDTNIKKQYIDYEKYSTLFFNYNLNCKHYTHSLKEQKKVENLVLSIYYKFFSSTVIDILLNNPNLTITDIIIFFIFDNVGNFKEINSFFLNNIYSFYNIYLYIEQYGDKKNHIFNKNKISDININDINENDIYINKLKEKIKENELFYDNDNTNIILSELKKIILDNNILKYENIQLSLSKSSNLLNKFIDILNLQLQKDKHFNFCINIFYKQNLKLNYLEASKPWIFYWCIHTIYLLYNNYEIEKKLNKNTFNYIKKCIFLYLKLIENDDNNFGGGLNQYSHIATTYATICVFIYLHDDQYNFLSFIDRKKLYSYILKLKCKDGSFRVHKNGEIDIRGVYCAICICSMCHILTNKIKKNVESYILSCQNFEGGISSEKYQECHGGFTYCGLSTLCILGKLNKIDLNKLKKWLINRQNNLGAFNGRTNKLVDSCYSFWIGSNFFLLNEIYKIKQYLNKKNIKINNIQNSHNIKILCNMDHLKLYLLSCSQNERGGMRDKPDQKVDYYHTCYALSGLSLIQNAKYSNLNKIHILYNITLSHVIKSYNYFSPDFPLNDFDIKKINYRIGKGAYIYLKNIL